MSALDATERFAFEWAKAQGFNPEKIGPNDYRARSSVDRDVTVSALTPGDFVREIASASKRVKRGGK